MRRLALPFLSVVLAVALVAPSAQAKVPRDFIGVQDDYLLPETPAFQLTELGKMKKIGVGTIRQSFLWDQIETSPGKFNFALYDQLVATASARGIKLLGVIFGAPTFAVKKGPLKFSCQPKNPRQFGAFAAALAKRYGSRGTFFKENPALKKVPIRSWQIWNEPNLKQYWCGKPNAKQYVALLKAAHKALNKADRKSETVTAGLPQSKSGIPLLKYLGQMYKAGAKSAFDTLAIHNYSRTVPEFSKRLRDVRKVMNKRGDRSAKMWVTEISWSDVGPGSRFRVGKAGQASRIAGALKFVGQQRNRLKIKGAIYVFWRDLPPYPRADGSPPKDFWGLHTGLKNKDGSNKRSFTSFRKAVRRLKR